MLGLTGLEFFLLFLLLYLHIVFRSKIDTILEQNRKLEGIALSQRKRNGMVVRWAPTKEGESSYKLKLYNDSPEKFFNIELSLPDRYKKCCKIQQNKDILEPEEEMIIFFFPDRHQFANLWIEDQLKPIAMTLTYTNSPIRKDFMVIKVPFKVTNISNHFRNWITKKTEDLKKKGKGSR